MNRNAQEQEKSEHRGRQREKKRKMLSNLEAAAFAGQMSMILKAGISGVEGLTLMYEDAPEGEEKALLKQMLDEANGIGYLAPAMEKTGVFPHYMLQMVEIGERTGNLDTVMASLQEYYDNEEELRRESQNAVLYPLILTCVMIAVVIVLILKVMPVFEQVYRELGTEMTGLPLALQRMGDSIRTYSISFLLILGSIVLVVFVSRLTAEGRAFWHNLGRHIGPIRREYEAEDACHFAGVMSMTLASGLTPEEGMDMVEELVAEPSFKERLQEVRKDMEGGSTMAESLREHGIFSNTYARMTLLAEKAGALDKALQEVAGMYRMEARDRLNRFIYAIEPALVILLSVLTGVILLSAMLPLLGIMSSL